ncbi:hypothetical protein BDP27DRAFT_1314006 [Rhodocollybia butyracea]|uniref:Pentatricopeptide repeat-containing protein n=1 Tax=Rhodocollybia butyracea TaxID=206335 RepID=A0A9P5Q8G0_9AGAR|nr:hypothetical protein BDP27DRAFT_1314006 [Rhodocollybia butyracea]
MFLRSTPTKSLVLFDFLAPNITTRVFSSKSYPHSATKRGKSSSQTLALPSTIVNDIRDTVTQKLRTHKAVASSQQADVYNSIVVQIKKALGNQDAETIRKQWIKLKELHLAQILDLKLVSMISSFLVKSSPDFWDPFVRETNEEIAIAAASRDAESAAGCMFYHIQQNDPEAALSIYGRCGHIMNDREAWDEDVDQEGMSSQDELAFGYLEISQSGVQPIRGRAFLLLAAITAHAMTDAFQKALAICKDTDVRFHHYTNREFLENLQYDPELQEKVVLYVQRLQVARLVSRPTSLSRQITNLGNSNGLVSLKKLYDGIIEGISGPDGYIAANESSLSPDKSVAMTEVGWTSFLTAFLKCNAKDVAGQLWDAIPKLGLHHSTSMWNALITGQYTSFSDATTTFELMKASNVQVDALTYRALIASLFNGKRPNLAMHRFHEFQHTNLSTSAEDLVYVYNTVLNGLLLTNRVDIALSLFQKMESNGPKPDVVSYNTFLGHYARRNDIRGLGMIMGKMGESSVTGDVFSFSTILSALLKLGREDATDVVFRLMDKQGVKANTTTYTAIIDHQIRERDEAHLSGVLRLLAQMEADPSIAPNIVTYTSILAGLHRGSAWLSKQKEDDFTRVIGERMKRNNVKLNTRAYNLLIKACLEGGRLEQALSYYQEMMKTKTILFHQTWYILLNGLISMKKWDIAKQVARDMKLVGVRPLGPLRKLVERVERATGGNMRW